MECNVHGVAAIIREPEINHVGANKTTVAKTTVVFERKYKVGETWETEKCYLKVEAWGGLGENLAKAVKPGSEIYLDGTLHLNQWEAKDGTKRSEHVLRMNRFVLCAPRKSSGNTEDGGSKTPAQAKPAPAKTNTAKPAPQKQTVPADDDDSPPF